MFQGLEELQKNSERGVIIFWLRWVILLLSLAMVAANIYGIIISVNSNWIDICGPALIILHVFSLLFAVAAFVFTLFGILKLSFGKSFLLFIIYVIVTILALLFDYILLGQTTEKSFLDSYSELSAFCGREVNNSFCVQYSTEWSLRKFARERTTDCYDYIALIAVPWTILFLLLVLLVIIQPGAFPERPQKQPDNEALNPKENDINQPLNTHDQENPDTRANKDIRRPQPNTIQRDQDNKDNSQVSQNKQSTAQAPTNTQNNVPNNQPKKKEKEIIEYEYYEEEEEEEDRADEIKVTKKQNTPATKPVANNNTNANNKAPKEKEIIEYEYYEEEDDDFVAN